MERNVSLFLGLCLSCAPFAVGLDLEDTGFQPSIAAAHALKTASQTPAAAASSAALELPASLTVHERVLSLVATFDLSSDSKSYGTIRREILHIGKTFHYEDASGHCVARAHARVISWGTHIDVTDCSDRAIGAVTERVLESMFKTWTTYSILDASGKEVAVSDKVEFISTNLEIRTPAGRSVATLHRHLINVLSDNWDMTIADHAVVDSRLLVFIAAYKTSADNDRRSSSH
jgi:uncharacterized protein YxjI